MAALPHTLQAVTGRLELDVEDCDNIFLSQKLDFFINNMSG
jgi:hypothetical protein